MPMKPSQVAAMHLGRLTAAGETTPAQHLIGEGDLRPRSWEEIGPPPDSEPIRFGPLPPPLPEPASEGELDQARYELRRAIYERDSDLQRLVALQQARERARAEYYAAAEGVREAEKTLRDARLHSRQHLIEAYVNGQSVDGVVTEADAQALLDIAVGHQRNADALVDALRDEIADIENGLNERDEDVARAAGELVSKTPEFLALAKRIYHAYRELRSCRVAIAEVSRVVWIDSDLTNLVDNRQHCDSSRTTGYVYDEDLIATWAAAATALLANGDAPLPAPGNPSMPSGPANPGSGPAAAQRDGHGRFVKVDNRGDPVRRSGRSAPQRGGRRRAGGGSSPRSPAKRKLKRRAKAKTTRVTATQPVTLIPRPTGRLPSADEKSGGVNPPLE